PLIGHWADRWNEAGVMIWGLLFLGASILLCFIPLVEATMLANGLRGIGWAGLNAGGYTLLASSAPEAKRGAASGYYSGVQGSASILFPAVALWLIYAPFGGFRVVSQPRRHSPSSVQVWGQPWCATSQARSIADPL